MLTPIVSNVLAVTLRLQPEDDLKVKLEEFVKAQNFQAACILTCVGSLRQAAVRYADQADATVISKKFEIVSLTGMLSENGVHLHISISDDMGKTLGGHLKEGSIIYTTAEVVIAVLPDAVYERQTDPTFGYKELVIRKAKANR